MSRLPLRTWGPYWAAGALWGALYHAARNQWPGSLGVAALAATGVVPLALIWVAHRVEQRLRQADGGLT